MGQKVIIWSSGWMGWPRSVIHKKKSSKNGIFKKASILIPGLIKVLKYKFIFCKNGILLVHGYQRNHPGVENQEMSKEICNSYGYH